MWEEEFLIDLSQIKDENEIWHEAPNYQITSRSHDWYKSAFIPLTTNTPVIYHRLTAWLTTYLTRFLPISGYYLSLFPLGINMSFEGPLVMYTLHMYLVVNLSTSLYIAYLNHLRQGYTYQPSA